MRSDVVILVPMLGRPHRVQPLLDSIDASTPAAQVLFCVSPDDHEVHAAIDAAGRERITVRWAKFGDYARKVNAGYRTTGAPLIFLGADDLRFHPGWLTAARAQLTPGVGVVGTNDLGSPRVKSGEHATHCLVTRDYVDRYGVIDRPGAVMHEGYWHEFVDDELVETAKHRGAWAFAADSHVEHLHPNWGKSPTDPLYDQQRQRMRHSRPLYLRRRHLWT